jgi:hypothetical protein
VIAGRLPQALCPAVVPGIDVFELRPKMVMAGTGPAMAGPQRSRYFGCDAMIWPEIFL